MGFHLGEDFLQGLEAIIAKALLEEVWVDEGAAVQADSLLFLVEVDVILTDDFLVGHRIDVEKVFADLSADEVIIDDMADVAEFDLVVKGVFREDLDERSLGAEAEAADVVDADLVFEALFLDLFLEFFEDGVRIIGKAARAAAYHDRALSIRAFDLLVEYRGAFLDVFIKKLTADDLIH